MEMNELNKASIELIINDQVALSIKSDTEIGKQQLQSFHPEAHYYSDPQFKLFKTDAGWHIEHDETAINETIVNGVKLTDPVLITDGMVISVGNAAKGIQKLPIVFKLPICPENNNNIIEDDDSDEWSDDDEDIDLKNATRDEVLAAVSNDGSALDYADDVLKADREIVLAAVSNYGGALRYADAALKADRDVVLAAVSQNGNTLEYANKALKADREVVLAAVSNNGKALKYANTDLKADRNVVLAAVSDYGSALEFAGNTLKSDREIIIAAIKNEWFALYYAKLEDSLHVPVIDEIFGFNDIEGFGDPGDDSYLVGGMEQLIDLANEHYDLRSMVSGENKIAGNCGVRISCLHAIEDKKAENISVRLKFFDFGFQVEHLLIAYYEEIDLDSEESLCIKIRFKDTEDVEVIEDNSNYNEFISDLEAYDTDEDEDEDEDEWSDDDEKDTFIKNATRDEVLTAVFIRGSVLEDVVDALKADREIVLAAVSNDGSALYYADDTLKTDREVVLAAVSNYGLALEYADNTLKSDREVVLAAVSDNGLALEYVDDTLKADREVVLAAVSNDGLALEYADDTLKADREVVLAAVSNNGLALEYIGDKSTSVSDNEIVRTLRNDITVRFPLTKGEGDVPDITQFSENELHDLRTCLSMSICWEPEQMDENQDAKIMCIEILYDGITHIEDEDYGYWFEGDELYGYPAPVVRFHLDKDVDVEQFRTSIFTSSYKLTTESIEENDDEPFYAEDHNGYTSVISDYERDELIEYFKSNDVFCGKIFKFPDGLSESGHFIPGEEFILENHGTSQ